MILAGGAAQVVLAGKQAGFAVVDEEEVPLLEGFEQGGAEIVDPVVHGVAAGEMDVAHLAAHAALQIGLDVTEEEIGLGAIALGQFGIEIGEDVEICAQRFAIVHIGRVLAGPEKRLAGDAIEAGEIDLARRQKIDVFLREILADDADDFDLRVIRGGEGDVGARSAEHAVYFSMRRFDAVIGNGSNDDEGHVRPNCSNRAVGSGRSFIARNDVVREVFGRLLMGGLPPSAGEGDDGERPAADHDGIERVAEGEGGQADHGADHPGIVAAGFDRALAHRRQGAAGHEGAAHADQAENHA